MFMHKSKKGFTIVELVIVIAVVAILAAVLIPTFSSLVKKANQSADQQAVVQMNKLLTTEIQKTAANVDELVEILIGAGYTADLSTYYANYTLGWVKEKNVIVLVEDNAAVFPADYEGMAFEEIKPMATSADALAGGLTDGKTVFVGKDITAEGLTPSTTGEYSVKLNGNTMESSDVVGAWVADTKLVVSNGVIDGSSITTDDVVVYASKGGSVELNNVQVYAPAGTNPLQCYGGTMVLNNVTTVQSGEAHASWYNSAIQVINTIQQVEGKWTIYGDQAALTVDGGMYSGDKAIQISAPGGNVTINGGTFVGTTYAIQDDFAPQNYGNSDGYESVITINGGTFDGDIKISAATKLVINGGTFSINPKTAISGATATNVTINGNVVDNGNGTWTVK